MLKLAVVIAAGPSSVELARMNDILASLSVYCPWASPVLIINDGGNSAALQALLTRHGRVGKVLDSPLAGKGLYYRGRLTTGLFMGYAYIREHHGDHHILKLDSDALVVRPFHDELAALLGQHPDAGLVGSTGVVVPGAIRSHWSWTAESVYLASRLLPRKREFPFFQQQLFGLRAVTRRLLCRAAANGYRWGYHANTGAALLTVKGNRALSKIPECNNARLVASDDFFAEDVFICYALATTRLTVVEQNHAGDVFGSCWKGLPGVDPADVVARGHAIIHSLKDHENVREAETRAFFRARRLASQPG